MENEEIVLGGNISLVGFRELDPAKMIVVKKMVGNYIKRVQDRNVGFESVSVSMKPIHSSDVELRCNLFLGGKQYNSTVTGSNIFVVLDKVMSRVMTEVGI